MILLIALEEYNHVFSPSDQVNPSGLMEVMATGIIEKQARSFPRGKGQDGRHVMLPLDVAFPIFDLFGCSDFRDRFYALLRLLDWPQEVKDSVKPDYSSSKPALMTQLVNAHLKALQVLEERRRFPSDDDIGRGYVMSKRVSLSDVVGYIARSIHFDCCDQETAQMVDERLLADTAKFHGYADGAEWRILADEDSLYLSDDLRLSGGQAMRIDAVLMLSRRADLWIALRADPKFRLQPIGTIFLPVASSTESRIVLLDGRKSEIWGTFYGPTRLAQFSLETTVLDKECHEQANMMADVRAKGERYTSLALSGVYVPKAGQRNAERRVHWLRKYQCAFSYNPWQDSPSLFFRHKDMQKFDEWMSMEYIPDRDILTLPI